jgi:hypothetical protein
MGMGIATGGSILSSVLTGTGTIAIGGTFVTRQAIGNAGPLATTEWFTVLKLMDIKEALGTLVWNAC